MKVFGLVLTFLLILFALIHIRAFLKIRAGETGNYNIRDKSYWAMLAAFALALAAMASEIYLYPSAAEGLVAWIGIGLVIGSAAWTLWVRRVLGKNYSPTAQNFDPNQKYIKSGPYRWFRHPMYMGNAATMAGLFLAFDLAWAWLSMIPFVGAIGWRIVEENRFLRQKFSEIG
jgi:protein-S-isoprenylcysteine O-methyltransferase Ste14